MKILNHCRSRRNEGKTSGKVIVSLLIFLLGAVLGSLSNWLDTVPVNRLPEFMRSWNLANILSMTPIWALIALAVVLFSNSPLRAAVNSVCFFAGTLAAYCLCSLWLAGFRLDSSYLTVWVILTLASFPLGYLFWYARGKGALAVILSSVIIAYYILQAFSFDKQFSYFILSCGVWGIAFLIISVMILYVRPKQTLISLAAAIPLAYLVRLIGIHIPYIL